MGIASEEREMSASMSKDDHSPVSAATNEGAKSGGGPTNNVPRPMDNTGMSSAIANPNPPSQPHGSPKVNAPPAAVNGGADLSSEDIDVTSMDQSHDSINGTGSLVGTNNGTPSVPEPNLIERLKRFKAHVITPLFKHSKSTAFREPVNAKALGIYPIYHQIITRPMDLGTVRKKIDRREYKSRAEAAADVQQVWDNAKLFNKPGHFVHEAAVVMEKVFRDKVAKLERDEASGVFNKPLVPSMKKLPHVEPRGSAMQRPERRTSRKVSQDWLPGEMHQPQQLKKKYVENLSSQLRQCDAILKELMTVKLHREYVEPFLNVNRKVATGSSEPPMNLYKIQERLQSNFYRHPLQFGNDVRNMVSEMYRHTEPHDPIVNLASEFHHKFEVLFSKVNFEPVANPGAFDSSNDDDIFTSHLIAAQQTLTAINENVTLLIRDLRVMRQSKGRRNGRTGPAPVKRKRPTTQSEPQRKRPKAGAAAAVSGSGSKAGTVNSAESLALRAEVARLSEADQSNIVQIMVDNNETITTDSNGYTEIDLGSCSAKTVQLIKAYMRKIKANFAQNDKAKKGKARKDNQSDASSGSSSYEDSSSESSSSEDSDD